MPALPFGSTRDLRRTLVGAGAGAVLGVILVSVVIGPPGSTDGDPLRVEADGDRGADAAADGDTTIGGAGPSQGQPDRDPAAGADGASVGSIGEEAAAPSASDDDGTGPDDAEADADAAADATADNAEPGGQDGAATSLVQSAPTDGEVGISVRPGFRFQFDGPLAADGLAAVTVEVTTGPGAAGPALDRSTLSLDLTRQNLSFALDGALKAETSYRVDVTGVLDADGQAVAVTPITFTTAAPEDRVVAFERSTTRAVDGPTSVEVGPDGHLYITTFAGKLIRIELDADGAMVGGPVIVVDNPGYHFIGLAFEPGSRSRVWVSQWPKQPADEFGSEIAVYDVTTGAETKKVLGLPRHPRGDHSVQSLRFNGGRLYASVGSVTTAGARSLSFWGEPFLEEVPSSAAILEIDYRVIGTPPDVRDRDLTGSGPIRLFATGLRNAYDLVWHSNGNLYVNINQNAGTGADDNGTPTTGPCVGLPSEVDTQAIPDTLNLVRRGGYYGHPNPARGECVVMGGGSGRFAVPGYDADVAAEPAFNPRLISHYRLADGATGVSVNGIDEYRGPGPLAGALLSADFSGTRSILAVELASTSTLVLAEPPARLADGEGEPLVFTHPLDVVATTGGDVYVADFGQWGGGVYGAGGSIVRLTPVG